MSYVRHIWSSMSSHDFLQMFSSFLFLMIHLLRYIVLGNIYIYLYIIFHWSCWELAFYKITVSAPVPVPFLSSLSYFILTTILGILRIHVCRNECWMLKLKLCVEFRHLLDLSLWVRASCLDWLCPVSVHSWDLNNTGRVSIPERAGSNTVNRQECWGFHLRFIWGTKSLIILRF